MNSATPKPVTGTGAVLTQPGFFAGAVIRDTSGATNTIKFFDNDSAASGTIVYAVQLAANATAQPFSIPDGVVLAKGLFCSSTGSIEGSVLVL